MTSISLLFLITLVVVNIEPVTCKKHGTEHHAQHAIPQRAQTQRLQQQHRQYTRGQNCRFHNDCAHYSCNTGFFSACQQGTCQCLNEPVTCKKHGTEHHAQHAIPQRAQTQRLQQQHRQYTRGQNCRFHNDCAHYSCNTGFFSACQQGTCQCLNDCANGGNHCSTFFDGCEFTENAGSNGKHPQCNHNCQCPERSCSGLSDCSRITCKDGSAHCSDEMCRCLNIPHRCQRVSECSNVKCSAGNVHCVDTQCKCFYLPVHGCGSISDCVGHACSNGSVHCLEGHCKCLDISTVIAKPVAPTYACTLISDCAHLHCGQDVGHCLESKCVCLNNGTNTSPMATSIKPVTTNASKTTVVSTTPVQTTTVTSPDNTTLSTTTTSTTTAAASTSPKSTTVTTQDTTTTAQPTTVTSPDSTTSQPTAETSPDTTVDTTMQVSTTQEQTTTDPTTLSTTIDMTTTLETPMPMTSAGTAQTTSSSLLTTRDKKDPTCSTKSDCTPENTFAPYFNIPCSTENRRHCVNGTCKCLANPPTTTTTAPTGPVMCHTCGDHNAPCDLRTTYLGHLSQCPSHLSFCMTDVYHTLDNSEGSIYKRCVDKETCMRLWLDQTSDIDKCVNYSKRPGQYTCHFCCSGDGCNSNVLPSSSTLVN